MCLCVRACVCGCYGVLFVVALRVEREEGESEKRERVLDGERQQERTRMDESEDIHNCRRSQWMNQSKLYLYRISRRRVFFYTSGNSNSSRSLPASS